MGLEEFGRFFREGVIGLDLEDEEVRGEMGRDVR